MKKAQPSIDIYQEAIHAAERASKALQKIISEDTKIILADVEKLEQPHETDAKKLAERCIQYYHTNKIIVSAQIKIYRDDGSQEDGGVMLMFIEKKDMHELARIMLKKISSEAQFHSGMEESAITEALNIIGNAYISVIAQAYQSTIMSMVPQIIDVTKFDQFIGDLVSQPHDKLYITFDTELIVTKQVIKIPFLLAVALKKIQSKGQKS